MVSVTFTVPGEPVAKERARTTTKGSYTPRRTREAEEVLGWAYRVAGGRMAPPGAQVRVSMMFVLGTARRKDLDNMAKILDGLNNVAVVDDSQFVEMHLYKRRALPGERPCTVVTLEWDEV